ncbi:MAG: 1-deoxy-D-xylulose-5-phosphate reductoisomerase [Clostridia bacterium]|nr:1-deoxy-D-xylulose-5-phosphate reductoisomerase [Clostridia bacterium]
MTTLSNKTISVLGSSGSVGRQALDVAKKHNIRVYGITASTSVDLVEQQIREFTPAFCAMLDESAADELKNRVADTDCRVISGVDGICNIASSVENDIVINSITGIAGLKPSLAVIRAGKDLALANKETIVTAGKLVMSEAEERGVSILPVDSEHSAIFQSIGSNKKTDISRILLTASGGPFFGMTRDELVDISPEKALAHPTWNMGPKITIDSASLMNKGFEVIEAVQLFGIPPQKVEVIVHRESIIHSLVEYNDRTTLAQLSHPDMRLPIQYAISYPDHFASDLKPLDLTSVGKMTFSEPDTDTFKLLALAYYVAERPDGTLGATLNGANERAVELFLKKKISFTDIFDSVEHVVMNSVVMDLTVDNVFLADKAAREAVDDYFRS